MEDTIQLEIVTPEKMVVNAVATEVQIPGKSGMLGILPGHAPLITELAVGEIAYRSEGALKRLSVAWGFAEVLPEKVTILAETAERAEDIDVARPPAPQTNARKKLNKAPPAADPPSHTTLPPATTGPFP